MATFNKTDINTENEAKEYPNYYGGVLKPEEKAIFDSALLKPNGTLDKTFLQDTAELLSNWKKSKEKVKTATMGLSNDERALLKSLLVEQKAETIPYQLINNFGSDKPVDKVISQFEDVLFAENEPKFAWEEEKAILKVNELEKEGKEVDEKIKSLQKDYNQELVDKQDALEIKVATAVTNLKNDLRTPGVGGRNFFDWVLRLSEISSILKYKSDIPAAVDHYASVVQTGYIKNGKPYTHTQYLDSDLPVQVWLILTKINKKKLFDYISSSDCTWNAEKKKRFEVSFTRIVNLRLELRNLGEKDSMLSMGHAWDYKGPRRCTSDIFYVMHALFPKDSNYKDSPFLKAGENSCLQFNDTDKNINTPYVVYWRGADASIIGADYVITSPSILRAPFPGEEKHLSWADGQIPEFFWQVYNNNDAIDFSAYLEILGPDAVTMEKVHEESVSVYEKKLKIAVGSLVFSDCLRKVCNNYAKYVENLLKNLKDATGNDLFTKEELISLKSEWKGISEKLLKTFAGEIAANFSRRDKALSYDKIKQKLSEFDKSTIKLIEAYKGKIDKFDDDLTNKNSTINEWDKWVRTTETKRESLNTKKSKLGDKYIERNAINSKLATAKQELESAQKLIKEAKEGKMKGLKATFNAINAKTKKSWKEKMFLRSILGLIEEWQEKYPDLYPADPAFVVTNFRQAMDNEEKTLLGILAPYQVWVALGENFTKRLDKWRDTDGKFHSKEYEKIWLTEVKISLESAKDKGGLSPEAENELNEIDNYLKGTPVPTDKLISPSDLKAALQTGINIFSATTKQWINYQSSINFKEDIQEIKKIADKVNSSDAKIKKSDFVKYLKENVSKKPGLPNFPDDSASEQAKLDWFWSLSPEIIIETIASQELVVDSALKETINKEMKEKEKKDGDKVLDSSRYKKNDQGEFSDEAIAKFYYEKLGGQNHSMIKTEDNNKNKKGTGFWSWDNPTAIITGGFLIVGTGLVLAGVIWWEKLAAWWDGPADAEGNGDDDEENE